jgi:radical SAM superfamily enzyme YgiQ (UPF0313 family)
MEKIMSDTNTLTLEGLPGKKKKILLLLLPYWTPMIPPMGISSLKGFLRDKGYVVRTADANIEKKPRGLYYDYFKRLGEYIPENKHSNFYSIGHHVLRNHMTARLHIQDEAEYMELLKKLIYQIFFVEADEQLVRDLDQVIGSYYDWLESCLMDWLNKEKPDVFGLTVYRDTLPSSMFAFKLVKQKFPHIKTVMGGAIFSEQLVLDSPDMELFLEKTRDTIDKLVIGHGEKLFLKYLEGKLPEPQRVFTQADVKNEVLDFSCQKIPDYSDIRMGYYPFMGATGSNGCQFNCSFCNVMNYFGKFQTKNLRLLADEMLQLYHRYGNNLFYLTDHMVNPIITDLSKELIYCKIPLYWTAYLRIDQPGCDIKNTMTWRKGGFYCARLGVESGSQKVLDMIGKKITINQIEQMVSNLAATGIKTTTYWFVGHPGETEEDFQQTLDLLERLRDDIYEAESDYFNYHYSGQTGSDQWGEKRRLVFPEKYRDMLVTQTWTIDCEPSREEIFSRLNRFVEHCKKLGIPNPYTMEGIYQADIRWKELHDNAVPPLLEFRKNKALTDDRQHIKMPKPARYVPEDEGSFLF